MWQFHYWCAKALLTPPTTFFFNISIASGVTTWMPTFTIKSEIAQFSCSLWAPQDIPHFLTSMKCLTILYLNVVTFSARLTNFHISLPRASPMDPVFALWQFQSKSPNLLAGAPDTPVKFMAKHPLYKAKWAGTFQTLDTGGLRVCFCFLQHLYLFGYLRTMTPPIFWYDRCGYWHHQVGLQKHLPKICLIEN